MNPYVDPDGTLHEEYTAEILLRTDADWVELGEVVYDAGARFLSWPRFGFACFCPHCGEVWAQVRAHNSRGVEQRYEPVVVSCERHLDPWEVPGSLLHKFLPVGVS